MTNISDAAARKLSYRSMSVAELRDFLLKKGYEAAEVEEVLRRFREDGYLDDQRFCREYFRYAFQKNKAKSRVFAELLQKGISEEDMQFAYEDYLEEEGDVDESARARAEAAKVLRAAGIPEGEPVPEKVCGRIARRLSGYGYASHVIYEILGELRR